MKTKNKCSGSRAIFFLLAVVAASLLYSIYNSSSSMQFSGMLQHQPAIGTVINHVNASESNKQDDEQVKLLLKEIQRLKSQLKNVSQHAEAAIASKANEIPSTPPPAAPTTPLVQADVCESAFVQATSRQTPGLTQDSMRRSRANWGHPYRLAQVAQKLRQRKKPIHVVSFGGSITKSHGVELNMNIGSEGYTGLLEHWLNEEYPMPNQDERHRVHNMAQHGADICHLAKRMTTMLDFLNRTQNMKVPDVVTLEYAVNDYQGQDHVHYAVSQMDVFFQNFEDLALCAEVVVYKLLSSFPEASIMFVEFRSSILQRKTAQMLHMGVAQHYQVPMISYADAMLPEIFDLMYHKLNATELYTVPIGESIQPFPYGCHECRPETMIEQFRNYYNRTYSARKCLTVCDIMEESGHNCDMNALPPPGREYCFLELFSVDAVHPSARGHAIAKDFIVQALATAVKDDCQRQQLSDTQQSTISSAVAPQNLPLVGWLGTPNALLTRSNFALVEDAECEDAFCHVLKAANNTPGFQFTYDGGKFATKMGWIASNVDGGEVLEFDVDLPERPCYVVYLAILRSYWAGMGMMEVTVLDEVTGSERTVQLDSLWEARISVWSDNQLTLDDLPGCTGKCLVRVKTLPQVAERIGNKAKILTLSARECIKLN